MAHTTQTYRRHREPIASLAVTPNLKSEPSSYSYVFLLRFLHVRCHFIPFPPIIPELYNERCRRARGHQRRSISGRRDREYRGYSWQHARIRLDGKCNERKSDDTGPPSMEMSLKLFDVRLFSYHDLLYSGKRSTVKRGFCQSYPVPLAIIRPSRQWGQSKISEL